MPWQTPTNFADMTVVTEAMLDNLSDNLSGGVMRPIAEVTLSAIAATVDFASIPATFRSLLVTVLARSDAGLANVGLYARINNEVSAGTYHSQILSANGGSAASTENAGTISGLNLGLIPAASATSSIMYGAVSLLAFDYTNNSAMKTFRSISVHRAGGAGTLHVWHVGATWDNGATLNRITLYPSAGNFIANSRFTLYGLPL